MAIEDIGGTEMEAEEQQQQSQISIYDGVITEAGQAESRMVISRNTAYNLERYMQRQVCRIVSYFTDNAEQWRNDMYERARQKAKSRKGKCLSDNLSING